MKKIIIVIILLIITLSVLLVIKIRGRKSMNKGELVYLEYKYDFSYESDFYTKECTDINISKERGTVVANYSDGDFKEDKVLEKDFIELDKILDKYDVLNWDKYKDKEYIDGDNTFIAYKYSDGRYGVISMGEYPKDKNGVFVDVRHYLNGLFK